MSGAATFRTEIPELSSAATSANARVHQLAGSSLQSRYDAVVFGNGPAASVFAIQMTQRRKAVLLVPPSFQPSAKPFGETLAPRGEFLLRQMGIAGQCLAGQCPADFVLASWREPRLERTDLRLDPHGRMWHVNRPSFDHALLVHATATGTALLDRNHHNAVRVDRTHDGWKIHLDSGNTLTTGCLVDATGRSAVLARLFGSRRVVKDRLVALSCICKQHQDVQSLLIEATSRGWWYSFPLPSGRLLLAFVTDPTIEKVSRNGRKSFWDAMLNEASHTRARAAIFVPDLAVASVESGFLDRMSGDAWIAIGDSAITFDPLSSHGLTSAIEQATEAAEILSGRANQSALSAFDSERIRLFEKYQAQRLHFYRSVRRFSGQAFWQERVVHCEFSTTPQVRGMLDSFSRQVPIDLSPKPVTVSQSTRRGA